MNDLRDAVFASVRDNAADYAQALIDVLACLDDETVAEIAAARGLELAQEDKELAL